MINQSHTSHLETVDDLRLPQAPIPIAGSVTTPHVHTASQRRRSQSYTVTTTDSEHWLRVLQRCTTYDVYHLAEYHQLTEDLDKHQAELFVFEMGDVLIAMPFILRSLNGLPGLKTTPYRDCTSVYGYAGPLSNQAHPHTDVVQCYAAALEQYFAERRIVTAFARLHPLVDEQTAYLQLAGSRVLDLGPTVTVDLTLPPEVQQRQLRGSHRREIEKARRAGIECLHDASWHYIDDFVRIYAQTMARIGAADNYLFDRSYFTRLRELLGDRLHLFVALKDGNVIAGSLFTLCNSIIQYHLSGTDAEHMKLAPNKLILDVARQWGSKLGATALHLGGGVGSKEDSLFRFKSGFSKQTHRFKVWQAVCDAAHYTQLVEERRIWNDQNGYAAPDDRFFPAYRCPAVQK